MTGDLFTSDGERKYLTAEELDRFIARANAQERHPVRSFCLVLAHTGCRISEALELTAKSVDFSTQAITFRTLKQRKRAMLVDGQGKPILDPDTGKPKVVTVPKADVYRSVPVPAAVLDTLELVHGVKRAQRSRRSTARLWSWGRTQGYNHVKAVMEEAGVSGLHASPKGLRHGFGVRAIQTTRNPRHVQKWLGHTTLETTTIYMDAVGQEEHASAMQIWQ